MLNIQLEERKNVKEKNFSGTRVCEILFTVFGYCVLSRQHLFKNRMILIDIKSTNIYKDNS